MHALSQLNPSWHGPNVLYFGDSIYADLVDARREMGWRTGMCDLPWARYLLIYYLLMARFLPPLLSPAGAVIRELDTELEVQQSAAYRIHARRVISVTKLLRLVQSEMERTRGINTDTIDANLHQGIASSFKSEDDEDAQMLGFLEKMVRQLNTEMSIMFNKNFGSVFRAEGEVSLCGIVLQVKIGSSN